MVWYGPNETNLTVNYFRRTHFEKEFARLFPPTILGISTLANSWRCTPCLARERLGKWKYTMPSKYMVSVVLGLSCLSFNQIPIQKKRGLKKRCPNSILLCPLFIWHTSKQTASQKISSVTDENWVTQSNCYRNESHTSGKGCPLSIVVPNLQIL